MPEGHDSSHKDSRGKQKIKTYGALKKGGGTKYSGALKGSGPSGNKRGSMRGY